MRTHDTKEDCITLSSLFQHVVSEIGGRLLLLQCKFWAFAQFVCPPGFWRYLLPLFQCVSIGLAHVLHAAMQLQAWLTMLSCEKKKYMPHVLACCWP